MTPLERLLIALCYFQSAAVVGTTLWVFVAYARDQRIRHIATLGLGHVIMTVWVATGLLVRIEAGSLHAERLVAAIAAFALSDYGIIMLYVSGRTVQSRDQNDGDDGAVVEHIERLTRRVEHLETDAAVASADRTDRTAGS